MPDVAFAHLVRAALARGTKAFDLAARVCSALGAATLRRHDLRAGTEYEWGQFHTLDEDIDQGLFQWEEFLVERFVNTGDRILVVGAGTGRDLIALGARGYEVCGVDPAPIAVAIAQAACRRRGIAAQLIDGYFEDVSLPGPFDVIVFSYLCYGLIPESRRRIDVLRKAKSTLRAGGRILISCVGQRERRRHRLFEIVKIGTKLRRSDWQPEDGDVLYPLSGARFHYEHSFVPGEIETEAQKAELRVMFRDDSSFDCWLVVLQPS
jgi:SAM-dependent methyltransferase